MTTIKRIIPCLDVDGGRVVKGVKFEEVKDAGDPVEFARRYNAGGADELAFLDISATSKGRATLLDVVRKVAAEVTIPFCVGGGIRTVEDMRQTIKAGAGKVSVCSSALARPQLLSEMASAFGSQSVVLAIDAKRVSAKGQPPVWHAFSNGGRADSGLDAIEWAIKAAELGAGEIMLNSIDADGTCAGYDIALCAAVAKAVSVPVIASGGAGSLEQIAEVLKETGVDAALVASLLHFGKTTVPEIKQYLALQGISVRQ
ncbi:MAG: imidazole glycerol phosphate synthase subunit HisF [Treponema sp.]|nr:imidazole glycerol phosphate synthase subunit HisF [Treponema sp.]